MVDALVAVGSNLGNRRQLLNDALELLAKQAGIHVLAVSRWIETRPVGGPLGQEPFLNGAIRIKTELAPEPLLDALQDVEDALGRERNERWGPRTIDLDLLLYGDQSLRTERLVVPHPRMSFRRFVLAPAREIAADMVHPEIGWSIEQIVEHLDHAANYVAIAGPPGAGQTWLARATSEALNASYLSADPSWSVVMSTASRTGEPALDVLRWIGQQAGRLRQTNWAATGSQQLPVVSDFWLDACATEADVRLSPVESRHLRQEWPEVAAERVRPKLVVLLDAPVGVLAANLQQQGEADIEREQIECSRVALRRLADQGEHGPLLWVDAQDRERMLSEMCAAIVALSPCEPT